jgi:PncC family amidohydrolase
VAERIEREPAGPTPGEPTERLAEQLVERLAERELTLAVAESLTGGLVGASITAVPGASRVLRGGVVAYATDLKHTLLGVDPALLARVGAVDPQVAISMARGVRERLGSDLGVATTGVAGPDAQDGHPPGTVWVAIADGADARAMALPSQPEWQLGQRSGREGIRAATVRAALQVVLDWLPTNAATPDDGPAGTTAPGTGRDDPDGHAG